ncbi:DUF5722 domain-containing protein [Microbacterium sp. W4I20]|uniref:DUF5722 domain-containing protein n=1 Tax=Microbacterium sp. W4I20 TaxID=3042262 RepID=UPI0027D77689|nr:DUF5722 domain-containing protein [Microbacterium sp. W4I20]
MAATLIGGVIGAPVAAVADESPQWTFGTPGDAQGWTVGNSTATVEVTAAGLELQVTGNDPWLMSDTFALDATTANTVVIHAQNETSNTVGKIYWETEAQPTGSEARSATFTLRPNETEPGEYLIDLRGVPAWEGTIRRLRIDPGENATDDGRVIFADIGFSFNDEPLPEPEPVEGDREPVEHIGSVGDVTATSDQILVSGSAPASTAGQTLTLYELDGWEYEPDYADGIELATTDGGGDFSFAVPRLDDERDRISSKFLVVADAGGTPAYIDSARYVTVHDYPAENEFEFPAPATKKGLQVQLTDDADELGVGHAAINIALDEAIQTDASNDAIAFEHDGETYHFNKKYMTDLDQTIKPLSDNGMVVNAILIAYDNEYSNPGAADLIIHPDAARGASGAVVYAFNTVDENSRFFRGTMAFLADRYTREDQAHGRVVGWIVGNEVNTGWIWQNMGEKSINRYVDDYERAVRWVDTTVRNEYAQARTYISLDHYWTISNDGAEPTRYYQGRDVLDRMNAVSAEGGQYGWNVAYHPYPENLGNPATWNDQTAIDSVDTPRVTFKNLHILGQYLLQDELTYEGDQRRIILSEQGFHAPGNDEANADLQAAAYAYGYYRAVSTPGIDSFILHRHVDHKLEGGLRLGLWTWDDDRPEPSSPGTQRRIYDVFKYIDTPESREHTGFALPIIGAQSWEELFPDLDIEAQGTRPLPVTQPVDLRADVVTPDIAIAAEEWVAGENVSGVTVADGAVTASFDTLDKQWRGVTYQTATAVDATAVPYLQVRLDAPGSDAAAQRVAKVKVYAGAEVAEGTVVLHGDVTTLTLDLSGWDARDEIDRVKVWVRGQSNADWVGELSVSDAGFTATPGVIGAANLAVSASARDIEAGATVSLTVSNRGGEEVSGALTTLDGPIVLEEEEVPIGDLASLSSVNVEATIAEVTDGDVLVVGFDGREYAVSVLELADTELPENADLLYDFEEDAQGWVAGDNVVSVGIAPSSANQPGTPRLGASMLAALTGSAPADKWRTTYVEPGESIALGDAQALLVSLNAYGGMGSAYEARISVTTTVGEYEHVEAVAADQWNDLRMPLDAVQGDITRLSVSFRATDSTTLWAPQFQVDRVALELADTELPENADLLYDFEEDAQGWVAGDNMVSVGIAPSSANQPGTPRLGASMLAALTGSAPADQWRTTYVEPEESIALGDAQALLVSLNAYGGMGSAYEARISVTTTVGEYEHVEAVAADQWNDLRMPLDAVQGDITRLSVSFRATDSTTLWAPQFQVDRVALVTL